MKKVFIVTFIVIVLLGLGGLWVALAPYQNNTVPTPNPTPTPTPTPTSTPEPTTNSGITGKVSMGPTCPVERIPPDPNCADKPYANAQVIVTGGGKQYKTQTDSLGNFTIKTTSGSFTITIPPINVFPSCADTQVVVIEGKFSTVDISCDTGIR